MTKRRLLAFVFLAAPFAAVGGCSLINSFGDVVEGNGADSGNPETSSIDAPAPPNDGSGGDASVDSPAPGADAMPDASGGGGDAMPDGGGGADADASVSPEGVLVIAGNNSADGGFVLTTLNPANGTELDPTLRENMTVVAVHYDGLRDLWYLFENTGGSLFPTPSDTVNLHLRSLDTHTGKWTESKSIAVPPIVSTDTVAVLNNRLAYVAYSQSDGGPLGYEIVLVDTTNASTPSVIGTTPLSSYPGGVIGTRNPSSAGGTINMLHLDTTSCQAQSDGGPILCTLQMIHVNVPNSGVAVVSPTPFNLAGVPTQGTEGFGSWVGAGPDDIVGFPAQSGAQAYIQRFQPSNGNPVGNSIVHFPIQSAFMKAIAVSECNQMAFVVAVPGDTSVYAVPFTPSGTPTSADLGHAAQGVRFEPYTGTVIAPFKANGSWALLAYSLGGTATAPTLTKRNAPAWNPPADLEPNFVGIREPVPFPTTSCP
ncbi:MAG TPA: hypothetical protein VGI39_14195 [Polyangiaceae bacterium]|jgi:hypothetical protein